MTNKKATEIQSQKNKTQIKLEGRNLFFEFSINGETIAHNRIALSGNNPKMDFKYNSQIVQRYLENGENEIVLEIGSCDWFNQKNKFFWQKNKFESDAYANFSILKSSDSTEDSIASITIIMDKQTKPIAKESDVVITKYKHKGVKKGHANRIFWTFNTYPKNMTVYKFTKKLIISDLPERAWQNAEKYTDSKEQREKLKKAYIDLWNDINNRDLDRIKQKTKLRDWEELAVEHNLSLEDFFDEYFLIKDPNFSMLTLDFNDFEIKTMNQGRTVIFDNKTIPTLSPLMWGGRYSVGNLNACFALIDGEFKVVR